MAFAPVEVRHVRLRRWPLGYRRSAVDRVLGEVADSFEDVWRERADLRDRVEQLESDLARYRDLEGLLRQTLVSAERTAQELKDQAQREAELVLGEAYAEARTITRDARGGRERLTAEASRIRSLLRSALTVVGEAPAPDHVREDAAAA